MIPLLNLSSHHTIAECGCGTGSGIHLLQQHYPKLSKILANDISEVMLSKAKTKNFTNTDFFLASNEELPYESSSCDRYISNLTLHFVENPQKMLAEAWRVLKPSGIAVFSVPGKEDELNILKVIEKCLKNAGGSNNHQRNPFRLNDIAKLNEMTKKAGFERVQGFFSAVPFLSHNFEELVNFAGQRTESKNLRTENRERYDKFMGLCRSEFERIFSSGYFLTFDVLILVAEKGIKIDDVDKTQ
jgi:ubiquinone/menaquinone biosynthesis C-methylase UbiE